MSDYQAVKLFVCQTMKTVCMSICHVEKTITLRLPKSFGKLSNCPPVCKTRLLLFFLLCQILRLSCCQQIKTLSCQSVKLSNCMGGIHPRLYIMLDSSHYSRYVSLSTCPIVRLSDCVIYLYQNVKLSVCQSFKFSVGLDTSIGPVLL